MQYTEESDSESESDEEFEKSASIEEPTISVTFANEDEEVEYFGGKKNTPNTESKLASILFNKDATSVPKLSVNAPIMEGGKGRNDFIRVPKVLYLVFGKLILN